MRPRRGARRNRSPAAAALAILFLGIALVPVTAPGAAAAPPPTDPVLVSVESVTPSSPARVYTKKPLQIRLSITNQTAGTLSKLQLVAERGYPISTPEALAKSMADPTPPSGGGLPVPSTAKPADSSFSVGPGATVEVTFPTTTSIAPGAGICVCDDQVYPIFLSVHGRAAGGADTVLGTTVTYLPTFLKAPNRLRVGWIWPIIDRPHRLMSDTVFIDDELAAAVAPGGRLDHLLSVLEEVPDNTPMTVLLDPETLDELAVMTGPYRVQKGKSSAPGTGQAVASAWLTRLRATLAVHPSYRVELTPYADPDVESLSERGYGWHTALPAPMAARVAAALGPTRAFTDLAWPAAPRIGTRALEALVRSGARAVVLNTANVRTTSTRAGAVPALAHLEVDRQSVTGLLIDPQLAGDISRAVTVGGSGAAALPSVMSDLAVRVTSDGTRCSTSSCSDEDTSHAVVLTPPRYVDPSVADAVTTISTTVTSPFTAAISVPDAASDTFRPATRSSLLTPSGTGTGLSGDLLDAVEQVRSAEPAVNSLLTCPQPTITSCIASATLLRSIPIAVQRSESSAWRQDRLSDTDVGETGAKQLAALMTSLITGVQIVAPSSGAYTLASDNASLPITVVNDLDYQVGIKVQVTALGGVPGFSTSDVRSKVVPPNSKLTIELPAHVQRSGRFRVQAELTTATGITLGDPVFLTVHSTALGLVGVIITIVAGVLLVLALMIRAGRALARNRRKRRPRAAAIGPAG